eukprot:TRINITY_DN624_c2_g2_i2.p1 TRINITY_DN624_c2_g2~~TRINITY_DN624_c2_g2_i2.p1  ORF type:complete len:474 (-),score=80.07 TRINITY_DN624_c2_g2_i2:730-2151(-)
MSILRSLLRPAIQRHQRRRVTTIARVSSAATATASATAHPFSPHTSTHRPLSYTSRACVSRVFPRTSPCGGVLPVHTFDSSRHHYRLSHERQEQAPSPHRHSRFSFSTSPVRASASMTEPTTAAPAAPAPGPGDSSQPLTFVDTHAHLYLFLPKLGYASAGTSGVKGGVDADVDDADVDVVKGEGNEVEASRGDVYQYMSDVLEDKVGLYSMDRSKTAALKTKKKTGKQKRLDAELVELCGGHAPRMESCVNIACDIERFEESAKLIEHPHVYGAFGVHPHNAKDYTVEVEEKLAGYMANDKCVAWGEMGLDYHYNLSSPDVQKDVFARQLRRAKVCNNKPLVIHTREAEEDTLRIMKDEVDINTCVHVHCFTSSLQLAKDLLNHFDNLYIGFTGVVSFASSSDIREVIREVPLNRILLETDAPFMSPVPYRGLVCHSGMVPHVARTVAEEKGVEMVELLRTVRDNTRHMYGI